MRIRTKPVLAALAVVLVAICWFLLIAGMRSNVSPDLQYIQPKPAPVIPIVVP
jgi:hypothetical protein